MKDFEFFKSEMNFKTRKSDFCLGGLDSSVFMDFDKDESHQIFLKRISFDGYGCYNLEYDKKRVLNREDSKLFIKELKSLEINEMFDNQEIITELVLKIIKLNQNDLDNEPLEKYGFL